MKLRDSIDFVQIIKEIKNAKSPKAKQMVMEEYKDNKVLQQILFYTFNPYKRYGITKKTFDKYEPNNMPVEQNLTFYSLLDELADSNINDALRYKVVNYLEMFNDEVKEIMKGVLIKDLDLGISATTVNKVWPKLIPGFSLQLAARFENVELHKDEEIFVTEKFDGIRCVCIIENNNPRFFTRQGKEIGGLVDIQNDIKNMDKNNMVLDGELLFSGEYEDSGDQYRKTTKIVNSKSEDKKNIIFHIFDMLSVKEFKDGKSEKVYKDRRKSINQIKETENVKVAPILYQGTDHTQVTQVAQQMIDNKREGVMVNRNDVYECKRTKSLLKVKEFNDADLRVIGFEEGRGENAGRLGAFIVDYKGHEVHVGSGYSKDQRIEYWNNKEEMIGKIIKVKYFEETHHQQGTLSLRFPVFLELRNDKDEVSYH